MAKISSYPLDSNISSSDMLIGTDADSNNATKNFSVGDLTDYLNNTNLLYNFVPLANAQAYSLVTQQHTTINTGKNVDFEFGSWFNGVTVSGSNQISFNSVGRYLFNVRARVEHTGGGGDAQISVWLRQPTFNINNSRQVYTIPNTHIQEISYSFVVSIGNVSDTIYVHWATSNLAAKFISVLAAGIYPTAPSAIVDVYRIQ